jgi:hypothetical protein
MSTSKTKSALRASLKKEDESLEQRLPEAPAAEAAPAAQTAPTASAAPAPAAKAKAAPVPRAAKPRAKPAAPAVRSAAKPAAKVAKGTAAKAMPAELKAGLKAVAKAKAPAKPGKVKAEEAKKEKREKVVRESFSVPKTEAAVLKTVRTELAKGGVIVTKSEILRAGLTLLANQGTDRVKELIGALPVVPKGKGKKS